MPKRGSYDSLYEIQQKITLAQEISRDDPDYAMFAGANPEIAETIVMVKLCLKNHIYRNKLEKSMMLLFLEYLDLMRKGWFASTCGELSKLGFIRGDNRKVEDF